MIQIASATQLSASVSGATDAPSGGTAVPFGNLFAKALSIQGASGGKTGSNPVAALLGGNSKQASDGKATKSDDSTAGQTVDPNLLALMQSLAISGVSVGRNPVQAESGKTLSDKPEVIDLAGKGRGKGQKLPNLLAALAGQQEASQGRSQSEATLSASSGTADSFKNLLSAKADDTTLLTQSKAVSHSALAGQLSVPASGVSGQEALTPAVNGPVVAQTADKPTVVNMQTGFGSPGWSQELGDKVVWMSNNHGQMSQIVLNPPSLGAVEVHLHMHGSEAGAQFFSANPDVRNALEAAMPRLREMMAGAGIALGQTTVSNQSFSQRETFQQQSRNASQGNGDDSTGAISGVSTGMSGSLFRGAGLSLLDSYA